MTDGDESKQTETNLTTATVIKGQHQNSSLLKTQPQNMISSDQSPIPHTADETKYNYVVNSTAAGTLSQITDIIAKPPYNSKYPAIKKRLIEIFANFETQKLLTELELGDKKQSQLLCKMH
ncbi:hypothetical protein X975_10302, partial [Stegodyphus mimosarum]